MAKRLLGRAAVERRRRFLSAFPLCRICEAKGYVTAATEVDHIVALVNGGADDVDNLQSLCFDCHKDKTRADLGLGPSRACDSRGYPVDNSHPWNQERVVSPQHSSGGGVGKK